MFDVPPYNASLIFRHNVNDEAVFDIFSTLLLCFLLGDLTLIPTIQRLSRWWISEYHLFEILRSLEPSGFSDVNNFDKYAADFEGMGDWNPFNMTNGPGFGHQFSIHVDDDHLQEVCSTSNLSLPMCVGDQTHLVVHSVTGLSDLAVADTNIGALEETLPTSSKTISTLCSQESSKCAKPAGKVVQIDSLERLVRIVKQEHC